VAAQRDVDPYDVVNEAAALGLKILEGDPTHVIPPRDPAEGFARWLRDARGWKKKSSYTAAAEVRKAITAGLPHRRAKLWASYVASTDAEVI